MSARFASRRAQAFRIISMAKDLIEYAASVARRNPQLIMLDVMPDAKDISDQHNIVSVCSVLVLIFGEAVSTEESRYDPILCALSDDLLKSYEEFSNFCVYGSSTSGSIRLVS